MPSKLTLDGQSSSNMSLNQNQKTQISKVNKLEQQKKLMIIRKRKNLLPIQKSDKEKIVIFHS